MALDSRSDKGMPGSAVPKHGLAGPGVAGDIVNIMTVDVEDYFQVSAFEDRVPRQRWDALESRVVRNTEKLLEIFDEAHVRATFFVLGWVAEKFPSIWCGGFMPRATSWRRTATAIGSCTR